MITISTTKNAWILTFSSMGFQRVRKYIQWIRKPWALKLSISQYLLLLKA